MLSKICNNKCEFILIRTKMHYHRISKHAICNPIAKKSQNINQNDIGINLEVAKKVANSCQQM